MTSLAFVEIRFTIFRARFTRVPSVVLALIIILGLFDWASKFFDLEKKINKDH